MPANIKIRTSYTADVSFMARLKVAIERDPKRGREWKEKCQEHLSSLIALFIEPIVEIPTAKPLPLEEAIVSETEDTE